MLLRSLPSFSQGQFQRRKRPGLRKRDLYKFLLTVEFTGSDSDVFCTAT